jgi:phosphoribosylformylglycinamidine (FGAM) synthase PurS component
VPTIVVEVMPKAELLDPQGKAVLGALTRLGQSQFSSVRVGKRFELTVDGEVTVSGTAVTAIPATINAIRKTMCGSTRGSGRNSANNPPASGPMARPPRFAAPATDAARIVFSSGRATARAG